MMRQMDFHSHTSQYGSPTRSARFGVLDLESRMRAILREIQDGTFAREWSAAGPEGARDAGEGEGAPRSAAPDGVGGTQSSRVPHRRHYGPLLTLSLLVGGLYFPECPHRARRTACMLGSRLSSQGNPLRARS